MMPSAMQLPDTVRVKLSSEDAGAISITPVVVRDMPFRELMDFLVASAGKRSSRICEILLSGHLVQGASRLRWQGWEADPAAIDGFLTSFPDPDPSLPFMAERCRHAVLFGAYTRIELARPAASRRRFLRRTSFWDHLMAVANGEGLQYHDYSYRDQADTYRIELTSAAASGIREAARLLPYVALVRQIESAPFDALDLYVRRSDHL
jgi:hypothetical protein